MIEKIEMVAALVDRVRIEENKKKEYEKAKKEAFKKAETLYKRYWECLNWNEPNLSNEKNQRCV